MAELANPMDALVTLQPAIDNGEVRLRRCALHPDLWVLQDSPNGEARTTYAFLENGIVQSIVQFVPAEPIDGIPCLSLGYATMEEARGRGLATDTLTKAIVEMRHGLKTAGVRRFYLEAVVSTTNEPSKRLAARALSHQPTAGTDHFSGAPILQYVRLITSCEPAPFR
jgi:hypothetical protein